MQRTTRLLCAALLPLLSQAVSAQQTQTETKPGHDMPNMAEHGDAAGAADRDLSRDRVTDGGLFRVSIDDAPEPIAINALHRWTLLVSSPSGEPIDGASISIDGGMPAHDHGLPTAPRMTEALGDGRYLIEGMKFQMPGHWTVTFDITVDRTTDSATFDLML